MELKLPNLVSSGMNENVVNQKVEGGTKAQNLGGKKRKVSVEALGVAFTGCNEKWSCMQ